MEVVESRIKTGAMKTTGEIRVEDRKAALSAVLESKEFSRALLFRQAWIPMLWSPSLGVNRRQRNQLQPQLLCSTLQCPQFPLCFLLLEISFPAIDPGLPFGHQSVDQA